MTIQEQLRGLRERKEFKNFSTAEILQIIIIDNLQKIQAQLADGGAKNNNRKELDYLRLNIDAVLLDLDLAPQQADAAK
jgi:hypothetical protein